MLQQKFCHGKHTFVLTKDVLLQQTGVCCNKTFVATKMVLAAAPTNDSILHCLLLRASKISCIHRKDTLSTQCSHKPAYCILYPHAAFSATEGKQDKLHSQGGHHRDHVKQSHSVRVYQGQGKRFNPTTPKLMLQQADKGTGGPLSNFTMYLNHEGYFSAFIL